MKRSTALVGLLAVSSLSLSACGTDDNTTPGRPVDIACATGDLRGAGSTFQKNIVAEWIKVYAANCTGATLDYQGIGSGGGIQQFGEKTVDFAGTDSIMKPDEQAAADKRCGSPAVHLPVTAGGIALAYNLPGVDSLQLTPRTIAGIFQGAINTWDHAAIKADNPSVTLPKTPITAVHRDDSSGTTKVFSAFLEATAGSDWKLGADKELSWPAAVQGAKGSDGVTQAAAAAEGGITYVEKSFVDTSTSLKPAKVGTADGGFAGIDGVTAALETAQTTVNGKDIQVKIDFAAIKGTAYPITAASYEIVCSKGSDAVKQALLKSFLLFAVTEGQADSGEVGFAPLPSGLVDQVTAAITALR